MSNRNTGLITFLLLSILLSGCGQGPPAAGPTPAPTTEALQAATDTPLPATQTPLPPTGTPLPPPTETLPPTGTPVPPPTVTPVPPTSTPVPPPTETPLPTKKPPPEPLSVAEILAALQGLPFDEFLDESYRQLQLRDPDSQFMNGFADLYGVVLADQFTNLSPDYAAETQQLESGILELLRSYDRESLSVDQGISYEAYEWVLDIRVRGHQYADFKLLANPVWGVQNLPLDFLNELPLETKADAEFYIARLSNVDLWSEQVIEGLQRVERAGALPPGFVIEGTIAQLDAILNTRGQNPPAAETLDVYTHFQSHVERIGELDPDERDALLASALKEVEDSFIPAYLAMKDELAALAPRAVQDPDQWQLPGGQDYYAYLLEYHTGTQLNADEIHTLALAEVARTQEEIRQAADELGYPAGISMAGLNQRLSDETEVITGNALKRKYEELISAADQAADGYFGHRATAGVVTRIDPDAPPAFYMAPPPGTTDPGTMIINPAISPLYANYNEHVLVHHETIPGHHTQLALAQELDVPNFRRYYGVDPYLQDYLLQAYPEGWALYAETLAWEMGLYADDPLANLGRLRLHLLRAARSVVDTGIHARGWTLDQAVAYLEDVTGMPQNRSGLVRYIVNPGYPNGFNITAIKIFELRQRAMDALGDEFDFREFHDAILGHGILPIGVLEQVVEDWIAAQQNR
jgi:uncharacterized protein (DUF885 family)